MDEGTVISERYGSVMVLTVNRPKSLNALNREVLHELRLELERADQDQAVKVVMITGKGEKAFAAGADISEFVDLQSSEAGRQYALDGKETFDRIEKLSKPVIAAVNGYALGGGLELALACDIRISSGAGKFGFPEVTLGIIPGFGGTARAARLMGRGAAMHFICSGETFDAAAAKQSGLVECLFPGENFRQDAMAYAERIAVHSLASLKAVKKSISDGMDTETRLFGELVVREEAKTNILNFLNQRK